MIQYYINNRPVPRAIARHHLANAVPARDTAYLNAAIKAAAQGDAAFIKFCADHGVSVAHI
jgi:hypothetical protein